MRTPEELTQHIHTERARQARLDRPGVPDGVRVGSLTSRVMGGAAWRETNAYPSSQAWADESERILTFAASRDQLERFLPNLCGRWNQFESALAELRVAFLLHRNGFKIVEWEPFGAASCRGEFAVTGPSLLPVFTEVKSPGWEGELTPEELKAGRQHRPKYLYCEGRNASPWERAQFEIQKAYKKFDPQNRNLLILADDLFISLSHSTDLFANYALYSRQTGGCFTHKGYENIGGVGFFWVLPNTDPISYEMRVFLNPHALPSAALPEDIRGAFHAKSEMQQSAFRIRTAHP